jgi:hypothetical protein
MRKLRFNHLNIKFLVITTIICLQILSCSESILNNKGIVEGKIFQSDNIIFQVDFYKKDSVKVSIFSFGEYLLPYIVQDSIINITFLENNPIKYKVISDNEISLIASPAFHEPVSYKRIK